MPETAAPIREILLRQCQAAEPNPWYPKEYAHGRDVDRESLYAPLNDLRVANLVQLTEWVAGKGQGYLLTPLGHEVLDDPAALERLRNGTAVGAAAAVHEADAREDRPTPFDIGEAARRALFSAGRARIVPVLIGVNIVAFLGSFLAAIRLGVDPMEFLSSGDVRALHAVGAVGAPDIARGEWWRLLTTCFLHFGLMHITLNMTTLYLCRQVEIVWGSGRFLVLYLICGFCGSCAAVYFNPGDGGKVVYLAGASGALWGVMASMIVWLFLNRTHLPAAELRHWRHQIFFVLLLNVGVSMLPGVSAAAHFGGGLAGLLAAFLLRFHQFGSPPRRALAGLLLAGLPAASLLGLTVAMEIDPRLRPFLTAVYREQLDPRVGKLPALLDEVEPQAQQLFLQPSARRDPTQTAQVRGRLEELVKQAQDAGDWARATRPAGDARPLRDKGVALVEALVPYAEALKTQAGGETVPNLNQLRATWQRARASWTKAMRP